MALKPTKAVSSSSEHLGWLYAERRAGRGKPLSLAGGFLLPPPEPTKEVINMTKTKCPFCSEEILADAKKCKHCGEWLEDPSLRFANSHNSSIDARAVSKGIKEEQYAKSVSGFLGILAMIPAIFVGMFFHWILGLIVFIVLCVWIGKWRFKE